jgi:mitotic spindle assembly checkpoint protein MAD2B
MAAPSANQTNTSSTFLSTHRALVETLTSFLTVTTHHILFLRRLYPPISFLSVRAYNYPVRQNRHPAVCTWINDAVSAVRDQLEKNTVEKVSLAIYECETHRVLERWTFDLHSLPSVSKKDRDIPFDTTTTTAAAAAGPEDATAAVTAADQWPTLPPTLTCSLNTADLEANFRATLSRISTAAAKLRPLPEGPGAPECSFTLAIEVKDHADRPVGRLEKDERKWMAAEPDSFVDTSHASKDTADPTTTTTTTTTNSPPKTHAVRRLETGELRMEVWVEESAAKFEYDAPRLPSSSSQSGHAPAHATAAERRARMSYGAGTDKFNPGRQGHEYDYDYDLEPADVNRKPQGGATTDYQRAR